MNYRFDSFWVRSIIGRLKSADMETTTEEFLAKLTEEDRKRTIRVCLSMTIKTDLPMSEAKDEVTPKFVSCTSAVEWESLIWKYVKGQVYPVLHETPMPGDVDIRYIEPRSSPERRIRTQLFVSLESDIGERGYAWSGAIYTPGIPEFDEDRLAADIAALPHASHLRITHSFTQSVADNRKYFE